MPEIKRIDAFIDRWKGVSGSERANYQLFITGLCELLDLPQPEPANEDTRDNAYVFERRVVFARGDGSNSNGFVDCYKRGAFVLEAKKVRAGAHTQGFDDALMRARAQGEGYARALPASEGRPPFVVVVDVGHVIELYAEFTRSGATYTPFPDVRSHRIQLVDLRNAEIRARLKTLWLDAMALDPSRAHVRAYWRRNCLAWTPVPCIGQPALSASSRAHASAYWSQNWRSPIFLNLKFPKVLMTCQ